MTGEHAPEYRHGTLLGLGMGASETEQSFWAVLSCGQSAEVRSHIAQVATGGKGSPLFGELAGIELGVDHHGVERSVSEQGLDDVDGGVVVQVFGGEDAPAVVRQQDQRRAIGTTRSCTDRD